MTADTIAKLLARNDAGRPALGAPGAKPLSFGGLAALTRDVRSALAAAGIGRGDRVAIVLPNGPEMAAAFITIAQSATTAPLNPAYRADEFEFYLSDLKAKALVTLAGFDTPARAVAEKLGTAVIDIVPEPAKGAGAFRLTAPAGAKARAAAEPGPDDIALVLHTSGTTSRPKIVPLAQSNVAASARHIGATLALTPEDRCLNIMPLFHIHGLIAAVLVLARGRRRDGLHAGLQRAQVLRLAR